MPRISEKNGGSEVVHLIYDADTKSPIFQGHGVVGCPILQYVILHQTILTIVY